MSTTILQDINVDPVIGAEIFNIIGVDLDLLDSPQMLDKFKNILEFFAPQENRRAILSKVLSKRNDINPLDHISNYVNIRKQLDIKLADLDKKEKLMFEEEAKQVKKEVDSLVEEIQLYE